ncbi:glutamine amidotransferase-related protein [Sediminibacterium soli]|uniref:glutamine amidotransferase-related protein n=1 Tax=Sediminibacterium soli TaxID=2698829 RepID=UPI00137B31F0|nr:hypothetical protein [Sediminibacterium soli]NCI47664.1 hypothetical protein [Sediminibacterium soli]
MLGICLGSQLIASAMGAAVYKGREKEIGFFPVQFSNAALTHRCFSHFTGTYTLFHWHGDTFDLPGNAIPIASSGVCPNQAFMIGDNALALQFHPEMTTASIEQMLLHDGGELEENGPFIQSKETIAGHYHLLDQNRKDLFLLLDAFFC